MLPYTLIYKQVAFVSKPDQTITLALSHHESDLLFNNEGFGRHGQIVVCRLGLKVKKKIVVCISEDKQNILSFNLKDLPITNVGCQILTHPDHTWNFLVQLTDMIAAIAESSQYCRSTEVTSLTLYSCSPAVVSSTQSKRYMGKEN